ncbi:secretion system protein [Archaeoglobales archaeon]|nr:MAG: secretion system protein [Archaeoglobales archaeon]
MVGVELYLLPINREKFKRILRGALLTTPPNLFSVYSILVALSGGVVGLIVYSLFLPKMKYGEVFFSLSFFLIFYLTSILYPMIKMRTRKTKIDLKLPHAITYMQSLCNSMPLYEVFKSIFQEKDLYGEVSEEFGFIVRDVELFGENLINAMVNLMNTTPSENLKELLEGLIVVFESGGDLQNYFATKSYHYRERAKKQLEIHLKTLEILSEVFVVVFVAMPIFLIVMISTMSLLGKSIGYELFVYLYFFIPVGSMLLIYVIDLMNIKEDLSLTRVERKKLYYPPSIISEKSAEIPKKVEKRSFKDFIYLPFKAVKMDYYNSIYFSVIVTSVLSLFFYFNKTLFRFVESFVSLATISFCIPLLVAFEYRARFVRNVEKEIPELLRQMLNLKDIGLTLQSVINIIKDSKIGVLSRELKMVDADIGWGATIIDALVEFINRVGISSVRRVISLIVKASNVTENVRDILLISIEDFEYELKMKSDRFTTGFAYLVIIYVSFFTFLYIAYSMQSSFLAGLTKLNVPINLSGSLSLMYRISLILALFSGILAGQMEKGHILNGLKHVCVFMLSSFILFEVILGGGL